MMNTEIAQVIEIHLRIHISILNQPGHQQPPGTFLTRKVIEN